MAAMMGSDEVDNVAGFAAELDMALDAVLDFPILLPAFEPRPTQISLASSKPPQSQVSPASLEPPPSHVQVAAAAAAAAADQDDASTIKPAGHSRNTSSSSSASEATISQSPSQHPVSCMQGAFQESIREAMDPSSTNKLADKLGAEARRRQLLELDEGYHGYSSRWRQKPDSKYHPLWKLVAQISFGVHLLHKKIAKSEHEVVKTLQVHVDEVDSFVEDTLADYDLAIKDIDDRLQALMLPLEHSRTFNRMLCERAFRQSIVDGNDIIERIIARTTAAMHRSLQDVSEGQDATRELAKFLDRLSSEWTKHDKSMVAIFDAMRSNAQGWLYCFSELETKAEHLTKLMSRLAFIVDEVAKRCGIASRRKTPAGTVGRTSYQTSPPTHTPNISTPNARTPNARSPTQFDKPLPPPPLRQKNAPGRVRSSPSHGQVQANQPIRPNLVSTSSSQTIDCTRPSPQALDSRPTRPSPGISWLIDTGSKSPSSEASRDPPRDMRAVSHQTGMEQLARRYAAGQLAGTEWTPKHHPTSPLSSSRTQQAPRATPAQSTPAVSSPITRSSNTYHEPARIPVVQEQPRSPPLTGLGISAPPVRTQSSASSTKDFTCMDYMNPNAPERAEVIERPSTAANEREPVATAGPRNRNHKLRSFSVFPSTLDPRLCSPPSDDKPPLSTKTTPRFSTDSRASDKIVVTAETTSNPESTPSSAVDSAYQSSLASPSLSPSNSQTQLASGTTSRSVPFGPDDITPYGALRSHPITASMYIPSPSSLLTALPPIRPDGPVDNGEDDHLRPPGNKNAGPTKKPSIVSMKNLFAKKPAKKEAYSGAGGLGGFVKVR